MRGAKRVLIFQENATGIIPSGANYKIPSEFDNNIKLKKGIDLGPARSKLKQVKNNFIILLAMGEKN